MKLNLAKSKVVIFSEKPVKVKQYKWSYGAERIEIVREYKYLGILLEGKNNYITHLKKKLKQSKSALAQCYNGLVNCKISNFKAKLRLFHAVSRSIMSYGSQIWGFKEYNEVEKLQRYFVKRVFKVPVNTTNYCVLGELGLQPLICYTFKIQLGYIYKTLKLEQSRIPNRITDVCMKKNLGWAQFLRRLSIRNGLLRERDLLTADFIKENFGVFTSLLMMEIKSKFEDRVNGAEKHLLYKSLKPSLEEPQGYFAECTYTESLLIFKLRTESFDVEARPYSGRQFVNCRVCHNGQPETVVHFLAECSFFSSIRNQVFKKGILFQNEVIALLNGEYTWKKLIGFMNKMIKARNKKLKLGEFAM